MGDATHDTISAQVDLLKYKMDEAHRQRDKVAETLEKHGDILAKISATQDNMLGRMNEGGETIRDHATRIGDLETAKTKIETGISFAHYVGGAGLLSGIGSLVQLIFMSPKK